MVKMTKQHILRMVCKESSFKSLSQPWLWHQYDSLKEAETEKLRLETEHPYLVENGKELKLEYEIEFIGLDKK